MSQPNSARMFRAGLLIAALALSGCEGGGLAGVLRSSGVTSTPDEFLVLPTAPLEMPPDLAALPAPTPGARNRVAIDPGELAVAGLTGTPGQVRTVSGAPLAARVGPGAPQIRTVLATEDAEYRAANPGRLLERLFTPNKEAVIYRGQILDAPVAFVDLRARGVEVPAPSPSVMADEPLGPRPPNPQLTGWRVPWVE